jgi:hypothetical protein
MVGRATAGRADFTVEAAVSAADFQVGRPLLWAPHSLGVSRCLGTHPTDGFLGLLGSQFSVRRKNEAISFAVLEHRISSPRLFLWRAFEFHATLFQFLICLLDVVARVRHVHKRTDPLFLSIGRKQHYTRLRFRNPQFDPALLLIERLIGDDGEPEFVGIKIERAILVGYRNANEFDLLDHNSLNLIELTSGRPQAITFLPQKLLSF